MTQRELDPAYFVNGQLQLRWEKAQKSYTGLGTSTPEETENTKCLFEFQGIDRFRKQGRAYKVQFGPPRIDFVCNHYALFYLNVTSVQLPRGARPGPGRDSSDDGRTYKDLRITFKTEFDQVEHDFKREITGRSVNVSFGLKLLFLHVSTVQFVPEFSTTQELTGGILNEFLKYLTDSYLPVLQRAGHHVLLSFPLETSNLLSSTPKTVRIDYSAIGNEQVQVEELMGVHVDGVNFYLKVRWLEAAAYIDDHKGHTNKPELMHKFHLAEHRSSWADSIDDTDIEMYFAPPQVEFICSTELIIFLNIQDILFYRATRASQLLIGNFSNWVVAVVVDYQHTESDDHLYKKLIMEKTSARIREIRTQLPGPGQMANPALFDRLKDKLLRYLVRNYMQMFKLQADYILYERDDRPEEIPDEIIDWPEYQQERLKKSSTLGYDIVAGLSQAAVNRNLQTRWDSATEMLMAGDDEKLPELDTCLATWTLESEKVVLFKTEFGPPQVQLACRSDQAAASLFIDLREGMLKTLNPDGTFDPNSEDHHFYNWRIAFSMKLILTKCPHQTEGEAGAEDGPHSNESYHLILDLNNAEFSLPLSSTPGLVDGTDDYRLIRTKREALIQYLKGQYFRALEVAGFNILCTISTLDRTSQPIPKKYIWRFAECRTSPFRFGVNRSFADSIFSHRRILCERNSILLFGMITEREPPRGDPDVQKFGNLIVGKDGDIPASVFVISRHVFLEPLILQPLELVNRQTTILPYTDGIENGEWYPVLTTWYHHKRREKINSSWEQIPPDDESFGYKWSNSTECQYKHNLVGQSGQYYIVKCNTTNSVKIPIKVGRSTHSIAIEGKVEVQVSFKPDPTESSDWWGTMTCAWGAGINLSSNRGLEVQIVPGEVKPELVASPSRGRRGFEKMQATFFEIFPEVIDFDHMLQGLKQFLDEISTQIDCFHEDLTVIGATFNQDGDLILDLNDGTEVYGDGGGVANSYWMDGGALSFGNGKSLGGMDAGHFEMVGSPLSVPEPGFGGNTDLDHDADIVDANNDPFSRLSVSGSGSPAQSSAARTAYDLAVDA